MATRTHRPSGNVEPCTFTPDTNGGYPVQRAGDFQSPARQSAEAIADRDSIRSMEERYGIGAEGLF